MARATITVTPAGQGASLRLSEPVPISREPVWKERRMRRGLESFANHLISAIYWAGRSGSNGRLS